MLLGLFLLCSCTNQSTDSRASTTTTTLSPQTQEKTQQQPTIIIIGDSITAGLGISTDGIFPTLLENKFKENGQPTKILNAGVSGDTTAGGLRRIDWLLKQKPDLLLIELGANDGLRGIDVQDIETNLSAIIQKAQTNKTEVMLLSMKIPANFGEQYTNDFVAIYPRLAEKHNIPLLPFLLQGVAGEKKYNQADGIHPTKEGHVIIADTMYDQLQTWRTNWKEKTITTKMAE